MLMKKKMFVRYVSHEIRTPLNVVSVGLQLLKQELINQNNNHHHTHPCQIVSPLDTLKDISISCDIAINILNELLDYDKLEEGVMKLDLCSLSPEAFIIQSAHPFLVQVSI